MVKFLSSYSNKLISHSLLMSLIPIILISSYLYNDKINQQEDVLQAKLISTSQYGAGSVATWITERQNDVQSLARISGVITATKVLLDPEIQDKNIFVTKIDLERRLYTAVNNYDWLNEIIISNSETGEVLFYTGMNPPKSLFIDEDHFQQAAKKKIGISDIFASPDIIKNEYEQYEYGVPTLLISAPISGEVGLEGILTARVNVFKIPQKMALTHDASDIIDKFLINSDGYFASKPIFANKIFDLNLVKKRPELELRFFDANSEFTKVFHSNNLTPLLDMNGHSNYLGNVVVSLIFPVKGTNLFYVTEIEKTDAYDDIVRLQTILISSISLIVIGISAASIIFANRLVKPIKTLTHVIATASNENNITQFHSKYFSDMSGDNEISKLYTTFYRMMRSVENSTKALRVAEKKYRSLYEDLPELCRTIDEEGIIMDCNNAYANSLGYSKEEIIGKTIFEHIAEQSIAALHDSLETWKRKGVVKSREVWFKRKDGSIFPTLLSATNLYDESGKRVGSNTVIRDISEIYDTKKELAEQKIKRLSAIGELCARIAHDLKNPLSVLKNTVEIMEMRNQTIDDKTRNDHERIKRAVTRIQHQVDDVLDFVRPKAMTLNSHKLHEIFEAALDRMLVPDGVTITLPENDMSIMCDAEKLEVVFTNLMTNAMQAMNNIGHINIRITDDDDSICVEVEDSGPGIPAELHPKIFDPLFTTRQVGTGLGLASCKSIVEMHGGTIKVRNNPTTFTVMLPKRNVIAHNTLIMGVEEKA